MERNRRWVKKVKLCDSDWDFCPQCGRSRTKQKALRDKLAERMADDLDNINYWREKADIALRVIEENK